MNSWNFGFTAVSELNYSPTKSCPNCRRIDCQWELGLVSIEDDEEIANTNSCSFAIVIYAVYGPELSYNMIGVDLLTNLLYFSLGFCIISSSSMQYISVVIYEPSFMI